MDAVNTVQFAEAIVAQEVINSQQLEIEEVSIDSRSLERGAVFFAINGDNFDGHDFIADAVNKGAKAIVASNRDKISTNYKLPIFMVSDTTASLQKIAKFNRDRYEIPVIAVTGSTGKTTTKDFIASLLQERYNVLKTLGNFNNEIGLPLTLLRLTSQHDVVVLEMGMRGLGQIEQLVEFSKPEIGVVTNVGTTHLELLKTRAKIAQAKAELIVSLPEDGLAVLNGDDKRVIKMKELTKAGYISYGKASSNSIKASKIKSTTEGLNFKVELPNREKIEMNLKVHGKYNVYNALAALAIGFKFKFSSTQLKRGLRNIELSEMRNQILTTKAGFTVINDTYNANPTSMRAAIDTLTELEGDKRIAVLGDMFELGPIAKEEHCKLGKYLATKIDYLITVGELAPEIAKGALTAGMDERAVFQFSDKKEAASKALQLLESSDTILVKASRGMELEKVVELLKE